MALMMQALGKRDRGGGLTFPGRGWSHRTDQDQLPSRRSGSGDFNGDLCPITAVEFDLVVSDTEFFDKFLDGARFHRGN